MISPAKTWKRTFLVEHALPGYGYVTALLLGRDLYFC